MTIKQLKEYCDEEIKNGNGDKNILITDDEEGNGYHEMCYAFTTEKDDIEYVAESCNMPFGTVISNIVLLG